MCTNRGKTCQNTNPTQTVIVSTKKDFLSVLLDPDNDDVQWIDIASETKRKMQFRKKDHARFPPLFSNKVYGCFVTAYGHEMLWRVMQQVGLANVIYVSFVHILFVFFIPK